MAEGRNQFVYGWRAVGLVFIFFASYYPVAEGLSLTMAIASYSPKTIELELGEKGLIPCKINTHVDVVYWHTWRDRYSYDLVKLDLSVTPPVRSGQGYEDGLFNITDDFSLVINNVQPRDETNYWCFMRDYTRSVLHQNITFVYVNQQGALQRNTPASHSTVDIRSIVEAVRASDIQAGTEFAPTAKFPNVEIPSSNVSTVNTRSTPETAKAAKLHKGTESTPTTDCPTDVVFKVLTLVSVGALVATWALLPCYLVLRERRRRVNKVPSSSVAI